MQRSCARSAWERGEPLVKEEVSRTSIDIAADFSDCAVVRGVLIYSISPYIDLGCCGVPAGAYAWQDIPSPADSLRLRN